MRKSLCGLLIGACAGGALGLPFLAIRLWYWFVLWPQRATPRAWPEGLAGAMVACMLLGLLAGSLVDAARTEQIGRTARVAMGLGLGALFGLLTARAEYWPQPCDKSVLFMAVGMLIGAALLPATAKRRPPGECRAFFRRRQFSMRGLLAGVLCISVIMGLLVSGPIQRWRLSSELMRRGVTMRYDDSTMSSWRFLVGESARPFFDRIETADFGPTAGDDELELLASRGGALLLKLDATRVTDEGMKYIRGISRLRHLYLNSTAVTSRGMAELSGLPKLSALLLLGCQIDDSALPAIAAHSDLSHLALSGSGVTDAGLPHLSRLTSLTALWLEGTAISDDGLVCLRPLAELKDLSLNGVGVTDAGLEHLRAFRRLERLDLGGTKVTAAGISILRDLPHLRHLVLRGAKLDDAAMEEVGRLGNLTSLDLTSLPITDAGLELLGGLTQLGGLTLDGTGLTDAGLKHLEGMVNLQVLYLRRTRVTTQGFQRFKATFDAAKPRIPDARGLGPPTLQIIP